MSAVRRQRTVSTTALIASTTLTGCTLAENVFKAGVWVGVVAVVAVLLIVGAAMALMKHT